MSHRGRLVFAAGLAVWAVLSLRLLPYGFHDLRYLIALDAAAPGPAEWVHPLFVPLLAALRSWLGLLGHEGSLLVVLEIVNLSLGALTLAVLFRLGERLGADALCAALGCLLLGFSHGFWEGTLRPDPYALAGAGSAAFLFLLIGDMPAKPRLRCALAGAAAGLTVLFHAAGLSLLPALVLALWLERAPARERLRQGAAALAAFLVVLAAGYGVFIACNGITLDALRRESFSVLFAKVEQIPLSSIYTSRDPVKQLGDLLRTLGAHGAWPVLALAAVLPGLALVLKRRPKGLPPPQARALLLAGVCGLSYALFFLINNSRNGFVYAALLPAPLFMGLLAGRTRLLRAASLVLAGAALALSLQDRPAMGPQGDPLFKEAGFLGSLLKPGDILVVPGNPFPELNHRRRFNFLTVGELGEQRSSFAPRTSLDSLRRRAAGGRKLYFAPGDIAAPFAEGLADDGAQKRRQVFWVRGAASPEVRAGLASLRADLERDFLLDCSIVSEQGWRYCRLSPRRKTAAAGPPPTSDLGGEPRLRDPHDRPKLRYLLAWLAETPGDPFVRQDLNSLVVLPGQAEAAALVSRGIAEFQAGRKAAAEAAFRRALECDPESVDAWMSLGAVLAMSGRQAQALACYDALLGLDLPENRKGDALSARATSLAALAGSRKTRRKQR